MMTFLISFFFNDTATTEFYTLSLHDALPISRPPCRSPAASRPRRAVGRTHRHGCRRSEEHTSELQSRQYLVCRLLLEKKKPSAPASGNRRRARASRARALARCPPPCAHIEFT